MFCEHCGEKIQNNSNFCEYCGQKIVRYNTNDKNQYSNLKESRDLKKVALGYSPKINDPAFKKYLK